MATPMTAQEFTNLLDEWSIKWKPIRPDWATHNRNSKGKWGPVHGVMLHHTGSDNQKDMPSVLWNGYGDLPGPLCHGGIAQNGTVLLSGWGRCNHAGLGDGKVLARVKSEDYTGNLIPTVADTDGNASFYGFEIMYSGKHVMSISQLRTSTRLSAAICAYHEWTKKSVIGHGEWQPGKWDPGYEEGMIYDMETIRMVVSAELQNGPVVTPPPVERTHKVKPGETPWGIAFSELGDGSRWLELVKLNPEMVILVPGDILKLPAREGE